ncbi:MAG: hypothetical protein KF873_09370 [Gemmataceae bacterium]|nr:hypothetical protein [Planctomycetia bacterium]MBX3398939.1 hypothetical protein [Gemmataceae bacterium]
MPIQFRCPSCDRMLGIAKRKAGTSVKCPRCAADVRVPALAGMAVETNGPVGAAPAIPKAPKEAISATAPSAVVTAPRSAPAERKVDSMPLFERPDFESLLNPALEKAKPAPAIVAPIAAPAKAAPPVPTPPIPAPLPEARRERPLPSQPYLDDIAEEAIDVEDLSNTIILTRRSLTIAVAVVALLMGIAFAAGYFLAGAMTQKDKSAQVIPGQAQPYLEG